MTSSMMIVDITATRGPTPIEPMAIAIGLWSASVITGPSYRLSLRLVADGGKFMTQLIHRFFHLGLNLIIIDASLDKSIEFY